MSFILGTRYVPTKKIRVVLTQIFGIGSNKANQICDQLGLSDIYKVNQCSKTQIDQIIKLLSQNHLIDSELVRIIQSDMMRKIFIGCYKGLRHNQGLPLRGQRTHTNAKTSRRNQFLKR